MFNGPAQSSWNLPWASVFVLGGLFVVLVSRSGSVDHKNDAPVRAMPVSLSFLAVWPRKSAQCWLVVKRPLTAFSGEYR